MAAVADDRTFIYRINADNIITFLNREWLIFAQDNQAPDLGPEQVLGQKLERFIVDWETKHLYEVIYGRVRQTGRAIRLPFRCDSPGSRRFFQMVIAPLDNDGLEFAVRIVRVEERPPIVLLDHTVPHSSAFVVICGWCKRIEIKDGKRVEIEEAIDQQELFGATPPSLTHDVCPDCLSAIRRQLGGG